MNCWNPRRCVALVIGLLLLTSASTCLAELVGDPPTSWADEHELMDYLLGMDQTEAGYLQQNRTSGVMTLDPVALPMGSDLYGNNYNLAHPIAAELGSRIVTIFTRKNAHMPSQSLYGAPDDYASPHVMKVSYDNGTTWSDQIDMRGFMQRSPTNPAPGMRAFGSVGNKLIFASNLGLMISDDFGTTWRHKPDAFGALPTGFANANFGPRIVDLPGVGLVLPAHAWDGNQFAPETFFYVSRDEGETWNLVRKPISSVPKYNIEPSAVVVNDRLVYVARSHDTQALDTDKGVYHYSQAVSSPNSLDITTRFTNIVASDARAELAPKLEAEGWYPSKAQAFGYFSQDTADLILNPVTHRVEAVVTNRMGRAAHHAGDKSRQSLSLWSIAPDDLIAGSSRWRYEGTLLEKPNLDSELFVDGMHPAGSVVDEEHGVQHIFFYSGYYAGAAGVFQITRPLDTPRVHFGLMSRELMLHSTMNDVDVAATQALDVTLPAYNGQLRTDGTVSAGTPGQIGQALDVNVTGTAAAVDYGDVLNVGTGVQTISMWFNADSVKTQFLARKGNSVSSERGWSIFLEDVGDGQHRVSFRVNAVGGSTNTARAVLLQELTPEASTGAWHHVAMVVDAEHGELRAYVDGEDANLVSNAWGDMFETGVAGVKTSSPLLLGVGAGQGADLKIDDFAIFGAELTPDAIHRLYENGLNGVGVEATGLPVLSGDLDGDGYVGLDDLGLILDKWNQTVSPGTLNGDPSGDGYVGLDDLQLILDNWNVGTPPAEALQNIPEPASAVILMTSASLLNLLRHVPPPAAGVE